MQVNQNKNGTNYKILRSYLKISTKVIVYYCKHKFLQYLTTLSLKL